MSLLSIFWFFLWYFKWLLTYFKLFKTFWEDEAGIYAAPPHAMESSSKFMCRRHSVPPLDRFVILSLPSSSPTSYLNLSLGDPNTTSKWWPQDKSRMEGGKKTSSSIADDLSPSGKYAPPPSSNFSSSSPGYFSSVFPPPASAVRPGFRVGYSASYNLIILFPCSLRLNRQKEDF